MKRNVKERHVCPHVQLHTVYMPPHMLCSCFCKVLTHVLHSFRGCHEARWFRTYCRMILDILHLEDSVLAKCLIQVPFVIDAIAHVDHGKSILIDLF